ncbi:hypothetical protein O181_008818 [Austropuccinia psidii MF-1]|uniref:U3 small nucleolar RNA-associated protein 22 n=1 Tax=Austropuccinia psidii MF-1 TaxID=1389203 RepID=A0A9Q3GIV2_9BASI|nr:hypothetical protein [Austropuccinia psidii MF-1]
MSIQKATQSLSSSGSEESHQTAKSQGQKKVVHFNDSPDGDTPTIEQSTLDARNGERDPLLNHHFPASGFLLRRKLLSLLGSIGLPYGQSQAYAGFLKSLSDHLSQIPSTGPVPLEESRQKLQKKGTRIALNDPIDPVQWKFGFMPPSKIDVVGSWPLKNGIKKLKGKRKHACIDLLVQIPQGVLQEKDYLSNRYFHKRAHYLAHIATSLLKSPFSKTHELYYAYLGGDSFKPIIEIHSLEDQQPLTWTTRIILSYPQETFTVAKLSPSKANLKPSPDPSPAYNMSILLDSAELNMTHHEFFTGLSTNYPAFIPTCQLMKAWAQRRVFYRPFTSAGECLSLVGFERFGWFVNFLVAHVLLGGGHENGKKSDLTGTVLLSDPVALWRHVIDWLAKWNPQSIVRMEPIEGFKPGFSEQEFGIVGPALIDPTGTINLLAATPINTLKLLCTSANRTALLLQSGYEVFEVLFSRPFYSFASNFDYHFIFKIFPQDLDKLCQDNTRKSILVALQCFSDHLRRALGNRVAGFALLRQHSLDALSLKPEKTNSKISSASDPDVILLGLLLNPTHAFNLVTYGPSPDTSPLETQEFRKFWGKRSQLRRFQDGSIKECVGWQVSNPLERLKIPKQVVRWLLIEKLELSGSDDVVWDCIGAFDPFILESSKYVGKIYEKDPQELGFTNVMKAFNEFAKELKGLNEDGFLPLSITSVHPVSEYLRYSSIFVPGPRRLQSYLTQPNETRYLPSMLCQLKFESSGKWPESLEAIQKIKAAMLNKIAEGLLQNKIAVKAELDFDFDACPISQNVALVVLHSSGYAFKLIIWYEREEMLLDLASKGESQTSGNPECDASWALQAIQNYRKLFVQSRTHHDAISALQTRFPSYTYTVRLVKRWFSTHMLLCTHISTELVELLTSVVYLFPHDELPPTTGSSGFFRFLKFMKQWNWRVEPLLIPLQTSIGLDTNALTHFPVDSAKLSAQHFDAIRKKDPGFYQHTYVIATENDLEGSAWMLEPSGPRTRLTSRHWRPSRLIADRIQMLASASFNTLETILEQGCPTLNVKTVFKSPLKDYDFHLLIDLSVSTRVHQSFEEIDAMGSHVEHYQSAQDAEPQIDDDPVLAFFEELQHVYGDTIEFFYDPYGGPLIAGLFNFPLISQPKSMRTHHHDYLTKPVGEMIGKRRKVVMDGEASLNEIIEGIGRGIICKVLKKGVDY